MKDVNNHIYTTLAFYFILQEDNVLTELYEHAFPEDEQGQPEDWETTNLTRNYLLACNKLFEHGFLSHKIIINEDKEVIQNI